MAIIPDAMSGRVALAEAGSLAATPLQAAALGLLSVAAVYLAVMALVLFHETIHALTARLLGLDLVGVTVGSGRTLFRWQAFGCPWEVHWLPTHGMVQVQLGATRWFRTRVALVYLAAPLLCAALCAGLALQSGALRHGTPPLVHVPALLGLGYVSLVTAINLLPISLRAGGVAQPTDVLGAWQMLRLSREQVAAWVRMAGIARRERRQWELFLAGRTDEALQQERSARAADPSAGSLMMTLFLWGAEGAEAALAAVPAERAGFAQRLLEQRRGGLLAAAQLDEHAATVELVLDVNEAFFALHTDRPELLPVADALSRAALARNPRHPACLRTRGLVELHLGQVDQGLALLRRAWGASEAAWLRAITACYLALAHALRGEAAAAREFLGKARRLHARCLLLPRYTERVESALARTGS